MEYLVRFTSAEGRDGHHSAKDLDSALQFAERVRNTEEATDVQVYRLQQIPIRFRACYKVEVEQPESEAPVVDAPALPEAPPAVVIGDDEEAVDDGLAGNASGRRLFVRG